MFDDQWQPECVDRCVEFMYHHGRLEPLIPEVAASAKTYSHTK